MLFRKTLLQLALQQQQQQEQQQEQQEPLTERQLSLLLSGGGAVFVVLERMHLLLQLQPSYKSSSSSSSSSIDLRSVLVQQLSAFAATCSSEGLPVFVLVPFSTAEAAPAAAAAAAARRLLPVRLRLSELVGRDLLQPYIIEGVLSLPESLSEQQRAAILLLLLRRMHGTTAAHAEDQHLQRLAR